MADAVGIGILGTGFAGRMHATAARMLGVRLVGVVASTSEHSKEAAVDFGAEQGFARAVDLIEDPAVEIVHVCTPNTTHRKLAALALERGKHVVCEKPLATSVDDANALVRLAAESRRRAAVCFTYRYQSMAQLARARVRSGELGAVRLVHGTYLQDWLLDQTDSNWRAFSVFGGPSRAFADVGSHWCDLAEWITGERIIELAATTSQAYAQRQRLSANDTAEYRDVDTEDAVCLVFRATGNIVGSLVVSQISPGRKNRLWIEVDGATSSVVFDQENAEWLWQGSRAVNQLVARNGVGLGAESPNSTDLPAGHARGFLEAFAQLFGDVYQTVRTGEEGAFPSFDDGLRSAKITDAVLRAARSQKWVRVE